MTIHQLLAFGLIAGVVVMLVWDKIRYDLVAIAALIVGVLLGLVPAKHAFEGFADDIVIIIGSALVVSAGIGRSGVVDSFVRPLTPMLRTPTTQVAVLGGSVAVLSAMMKNIGALAIFMPPAMQLARRHGTGADKVLMPMAFASLLGGLMTLIGTSPNIIVSRVREELTGEPFAMFDYLPVGAGLTLAGMAFLVVGWRLLPRREGARSPEEAFAVETYASEMRLPATSDFRGRTVAELEKLAGGEARVFGVIRERFRRYTPDDRWVLSASDVLLIEGDAPALQKLVQGAGLLPAGLRSDVMPPGGATVVEGVVQRGSPLIGGSALSLDLLNTRRLGVLAISRPDQRPSQRLQRVAFREGDLVLFMAPDERVAETFSDAGLLPLAGRRLQIGRRRPTWVPVSIVVVTMVVLALQLLPVAVVFLAAAAAMVLSGVLKPEEAYAAVEWPILILVGALIPVSGALERTGGTDLVAGWLAGAANALPPVANITLVMAAAMAVTPFLNNAATVLVMAPIGASLAEKLGLNPDPFLMAVAVGAGSDFLTPIGHQCNTLVFGPGGYRFGDYSRLGAPLSLLILALGTTLIVLVWPLKT